MSDKPTVAPDPAPIPTGGCPCLYVTPCSKNCTCANKFMSGGCRRCARYGSIEQRTAAATHIAAVLDTDFNQQTKGKNHGNF